MRFGVAKPPVCHSVAADAPGLIFVLLFAVFFLEPLPFPRRHLFILPVLALHRLAFVRRKTEIPVGALSQPGLFCGVHF